MNRLEILIADDHEAFRSGLRSLLEANREWHVCGEAADGPEAIRKSRELGPDLILMDVSMPGMSGLDATRLILTDSPESKILIVSQNEPALMRQAAAQAGAIGFVHKSRVSQDLPEAIRSLAKTENGSERGDGNGNSGRADASVARHVISVRGTRLLPTDTREQYREKIARITLDSMVQFVGLLDAKGTVLEINRVALDAVGIEFAEVEGKPFWTTFWWQVSEEMRTILKESIVRAAQGEFVRWDAEIYGRAGGKETIIIDASLCPVKDENGTVVFITAEGRDITEKKAHEREIARQREELAKLDELKTEFFANISHEFRTPLTLMMGPLEDAMAGSEGLSAENRERLQLAHRNSLRLLKLVNTLLDFSRIEAGRIQASYEPTDLSEFTTGLAGVFRAAIERAGMRLVVNCPPLPEKVWIDREMWEKIVLNLLSNAFKFTFEGEISVSLRPVSGGAEMSVRDTGTGIPAEEIPQLFERFHRVRGARGRSFEGSGIGLALVQELIRLHGGTVRIESEVDRGSNFIVTVPFGRDHLPADRIGGARTLASTNSGGEAYVQEALRWLPEPQDVIADVPPALLPDESTAAVHPAPKQEKPARILLADDNADMREYVHHLLQGQYEVVAAGDGESALKKARENPPDLILSDIMMPAMDGFGLLRTLRADPDLKGIPVILLSARAGEDSRVEGLDAGADDYLVKPFSARELLARVASHLAMAGVRRESQERERRLRSEAELEGSRIRELFMQAPAAIGLLSGPEHRWTFLNPECVRLTGREGAEDFIGKTVRETLPEVESQGFLGLLDRVYHTGIPYAGTEARIQLNRSGGQPDEAYVNFIYQPVRNTDENVEGILVHAIEVTREVLARQELAAAARHQKALFHLADGLHRATSREEVYNAAMDAICEALQCDRASILLCEENGPMRFAHWRGLSESYRTAVEGHSPWKSDDPDPRPVLIENIETAEIDPALRAAIRTEGIVSLAFIPLLSDEKLIGKFMAYFPGIRSFGRDELDLCIAISRQLAFAIERKHADEALRRSEEQFRGLSERLDAEVRLRTRELEERGSDLMKQSEQMRKLSRRLLQTQDEERRHIARELHDSAGQTLTVLGMNLGQLLHDARKTAPALAEQAESTEQLVQQLAREIRTMSYLLHPPLLDESGLASALPWYTQGLSSRSGLSVDLRIAEDFGRIPREMELVVFRLVQECLTNIHRHSGAKNAEIRIERSRHNLFVEVSDDGRGMPPEKLAEVRRGGSGVGIGGMRERVRQFKGEMKIESSPAGTKILVEFRLPEHPDGP